MQACKEAARPGILPAISFPAHNLMRHPPLDITAAAQGGAAGVDEGAVATGGNLDSISAPTATAGKSRTCCLLGLQLVRESCQRVSAKGDSRKSGGAQGWEVVGQLCDLLVPEVSISSQAQPIAMQGRDESGNGGGGAAGRGGGAAAAATATAGGGGGDDWLQQQRQQLEAVARKQYQGYHIDTAGPGGAGGKGARAAGEVEAGAAADAAGTAAAGREGGGGYGSAERLGPGKEDIQRAAAGNSVIGPGIKEEMWVKAKLWQPCVIGGLPSVYGIQGSLASLN